MEKAQFQITEQKYKDVQLDKLLQALNLSREGTKYKPITYARLNKMLQKVGKSKKNWDRNVWIANVMDAQNPAKYFWYIIKQ